MNKSDFNIFSLLWTVLFHGLLLFLLWLICFDIPQPQDESGVPVMLGSMGNLDTDYEFTEVSPMPAPPSAAAPQPVAPQAEPNLTQNMEETVAIESGEKEKPSKPVETVTQPTPEQIQAERERQAQETAQNLMANAFGKSSSMQASTPAATQSDAGTPGTDTGNATEGKTSGTGSYGTFDLGGRGLADALPKPVYKGINEEGRVVVTIVVDSDGNVISTNINNRTNTTNMQLRTAALEAARKAKFNPIAGVDDQSGTITYYFKLN